MKQTCTCIYTKMQSSNSVKKSVFVCKPLVVLYNIMMIYDLKKTFFNRESIVLVI